MNIYRECIHRVCEASGLRTAADKKRRKTAEKKIVRMLGPSAPSMDKAGSNVQLTITSLWLKLSDLDSGEVRHHSHFQGCNIHYIQITRVQFPPYSPCIIPFAANTRP